MRLFGTDGVRGKTNRPPMTPENVLRIGMAAARVLRKKHGRNMVLIGKDTRLSGYMIESALTSGICSMGMNVTVTGPLPTPGIAFLTRALRADAGVVISASHNPFEDNGIKFFSSDGCKLPDELEQRIEELVVDDGLGSRRPSGADIGKAFRLDDATGRYIEYIKSTIARGSTLEGLKVVVDCANGAAYKVTPWVLRELGADVIAIHDRPDGININEGCGTLHMESLFKAVRAHKADAGIAHDGDADRTLMCDEKGCLVDGDKLLGLWAVQLKKKALLKGDAVVSTVMSNLGLENYLAEEGIRMFRTKVGDRFVAEKMSREGYVLGGEPSGHIICLYGNTTGDGPITALHVLSMMKKEATPLSRLVAGITLYPQVLINVPVEKKTDMKSVPEVLEAVRDAEGSLDGRGRVIVRPSGTEPKVRVMVEADEERLAEKWAKEIAGVIKKKMSA
ncbi:MAG TPA: phosphoglucosamine mutase [Thermodesulfovibrionales bacterium]|nr:phosphoglucosamine mutase [Thermodesulfovibrionales bacterium]